MEEIEKVSITKSQYNLLNRIRGLQQDAFYMVIQAKEVQSGYILEGSDETFSHLLHDLYDECEIAPRSKVKSIHSLIHRLEPEESDLD